MQHHYKCLGCGEIRYAVTVEDALSTIAAMAHAGATLLPYLRCRRCSSSTSTFVPIEEAYISNGKTISACLVQTEDELSALVRAAPERWPMVRLRVLLANMHLKTSSVFNVENDRADILFLGISGVLHPSASTYRLARGVEPWGDGHSRYEGVQVLERALAPYRHVRIVLTSTQPWKHGLGAVIAELGPLLGERVDGFAFDMLTNRGTLSADHYWRLDKSGIVALSVARLRPQAWVAIDDEGMRWPFEVRENQLVRTDGCEGLLTAETEDRLHTVLAANFQR